MLKSCYVTGDHLRFQIPIEYEHFKGLSSDNSCTVCV